MVAYRKIVNVVKKVFTSQPERRGILSCDGKTEICQTFLSLEEESAEQTPTKNKTQYKSTNKILHEKLWHKIYKIY